MLGIYQRLNNAIFPVFFHPISSSFFKLLIQVQSVETTFKWPEAEFKEFERRLKIKPRLKYGWFHLKLYQMFQGLSRCSIETGFWRI